MPKNKLFLKNQQLNGKFVRAFETHPSPFVNDKITDVRPLFGDEIEGRWPGNPWPFWCW